MVKWLKRIRSFFRTFLSLLVIPLPSWLKVPIYRGVFKYRIGRDVKIGFTWILVDRLEIEDHVRIGHLNRFKDIPEVIVRDHCIVSHFNQFIGSVEFTHPDGLRERGNRPRLVLGRHSGISMFHHLDVNDSLEIGDFTIFAGVGSIVFTHYLDVMTCAQTPRPVHIGAYCMVGSAVRIVPGARVPDCSVVAMGAVVSGTYAESHCLIAGNPAAVVRRYPADAPFFHRTRGWIASHTPTPFGDDAA